MAAADDAFAAVAAGDAERLRSLLAEDPALAHARDGAGVSLVLRAQYRMDDELVAAVGAVGVELDAHEAAALGDTDRLRVLLDGEPERVRALAADGFAPLHLAAFFRRPHAVRLLLERGADANVPAANEMGVTPLHSAAAAVDRESVRLLLEAGADPSARQGGGYTPLHSAAAGGDRELVELLIERGADPAAASDDGHTPADLARERGHGELADLLGERS